MQRSDSTAAGGWGKLLAMGGIKAWASSTWRLFSTVAGILTILFFIFRPLWRLVQYGGDVDTVLTYYRPFLEFLDSPYGSIVLLAVGCILLGYAVTAVKRAEEKKYIEYKNLQELHRKEIDAHIKRVLEPIERVETLIRLYRKRDSMINLRDKTSKVKSMLISERENLEKLLCNIKNEGLRTDENTFIYDLDSRMRSIEGRIIDLDEYLRVETQSNHEVYPNLSQSLIDSEEVTYEDIIPKRLKSQWRTFYVKSNIAVKRIEKFLSDIDREIKETTRKLGKLTG